MTNPTPSGKTRPTLTKMRWNSPFPPDIAFSGVVESGANEGGAEASRGVDESWVDPAHFRLPPEERALLPGTVHPRRLLEFTLGRGCARMALASLEPSLAGAPILRTGMSTGDRTPRWPGGAVGAITHHKGRAAAAVAWQANYAGLGLDLEARRAMSGGMRRRLLRPEERARLEGLPEAEADLAAMIVFSAKESIYKCLHPITGIYLGFQDAEVFVTVASDGELSDGVASDGVGVPPGVGTLRWRLHKDSGPRFPAGYEGVGAYVLQPGFVLTGLWVAAG